MTRDEIAAFFPDHDIDFGCGNYEVPTLEWVQKVAWPAFQTWLWSMGCKDWSARFECRDFARLLAAFIVVLWANTKSVDSGSDGVSIGEIWFIPDHTKPLDGHAICPLICDKGLVFIEPQTGEQYPMNTMQLMSEYFLRF